MNFFELARQKMRIFFIDFRGLVNEKHHREYRGNVNTIGIRSCYDEGKRVAETLMMDYHNKYGPHSNRSYF